MPSGQHGWVLLVINLLKPVGRVFIIYLIVHFLLKCVIICYYGVPQLVSICINCHLYDDNLIAEVYKASYKGNIVAVKVIQCSQNTLQAFLAEASLMT